jgi:hypothetical protein
MKTPTLIATALLASLSATSTHAFETGQEGHGGSGIACFSENGSTMTSFTLLDLVEGSGYGLPFENEAGYGFAIAPSNDAALPLEEKLKRADAEINIQLLKLSRYGELQALILKEINRVKAAQTLINPQYKLSLSKDIGKTHYDMLPRHCELYQTALYKAAIKGQNEEVKVKLDQVAFALMDSKNISSFYIHEAIFKIFRSFYGNDVSSEIPRKLSALLASEKTDPEAFAELGKFAKMSQNSLDSLIALLTKYNKPQFGADCYFSGKNGYFNIMGNIASGMMTLIDYSNRDYDGAFFHLSQDSGVTSEKDILWSPAKGVFIDFLNSDGTQIAIYYDGKIVGRYTLNLTNRL